MSLQFVGQQILDRRRFILEHTSLLPVTHTPEIKLYMAHEAEELWQKTETDLVDIGLPPPYWAFAWAGGQALARYILDHPSIVTGKRILDFGAGSGLCGIAAAKAGARRVEAADIDIFAMHAIALNAAANDVSISVTIDDLIGNLEVAWEVVLVGDVFYEEALAKRATQWLEQLVSQGSRVLVGDPGRYYLPRERLKRLKEYQIATTRELEDSDVKKTSVWLFS